jgi:hypothetical protein
MLARDHAIRFWALEADLDPAEFYLHRSRVRAAFCESKRVPPFHRTIMTRTHGAHISHETRTV